MKIHLPAQVGEGPWVVPLLDLTFLVLVSFTVTLDLGPRHPVDVSLPFARSESHGSEVPPVCLTVYVQADGDLVFQGHRHALGTGTSAEQLHALVSLRDELQTLTANPEWRDGLAPPRVLPVIRADRRAPWEYVSRILELCAEPTIAIRHIQFVVRPLPRRSETNEPRPESRPTPPRDARGSPRSHP